MIRELSIWQRAVGPTVAVKNWIRTGLRHSISTVCGIATLLPGNVEAGIVLLDPRACRLPAPPRVELALYRRPALRNDPVADFLENLLWKATAG
ncbi:MAG TPA: hypothetical protein VFR54_09320 [Xanthobacteraceae bacterium]|jgi:hypothetical protein|nr:hypothetical protein [Xanthobacteraceae bacterium]